MWRPPTVEQIRKYPNVYKIEYLIMIITFYFCGLVILCAGIFEIIFNISINGLDILSVITKIIGGVFLLIIATVLLKTLNSNKLRSK
jgi:arginine exporter protein ArgO